MIETYTLFGAPSPLGTVGTPGLVKLSVDWHATGPAVARGAGNAGTPAEAFVGQFAPARAAGRCSGLELDFSFASSGKIDSAHAYAEIGTEQNGSFL